MSLPKRTIAEIQTKAKFEPSLCDIYVEGHFDVDMVRWYLANRNAPRTVEVYPIDSVQVPSDLPDGISPTGGNRTRVIRLANAIWPSVPTDRVLFIIDLDFDALASRGRPEWVRQTTPNVLKTDWAALELYLFTIPAVSKMLRLAGRHHGVDEALLLSSAGEVLSQVFALRYVSVVGEFNLTFPDFCRACRLQGSTVTLDGPELLQRLLNKNALDADERQRFQVRLAESISLLPEERRLVIHGHDYVDLIYWILNHLSCNPSRDRDTFERWFVVTAELGELVNGPMFAALESVVRGQRA